MRTFLPRSLIQLSEHGGIWILTDMTGEHRGSTDLRTHITNFDPNTLELFNQDLNEGDELPPEETPEDRLDRLMRTGE